MSAYVLTFLAKTEIFDIWSSLAEDSESAADRVEQAIYDACAFLAEDAVRDQGRSDLPAPSLGFWTLNRYPEYTVVYRPETVPLRIMAVLSGDGVSGAFSNSE
jgi:plasmid stabilization system protein ParE